MGLNEDFEQVLLETSSNDVTDLFVQSCKLIIKISKIFSLFIKPEKLHEADDWKEERRKFNEIHKEVNDQLDLIMPDVEQSIANITAEENRKQEEVTIDSNEAADFIEDTNLNVPIIQRGFDRMGAQAINYLNSVNLLFEKLNHLNKISKKNPKRNLPLITKLINHFHRK